MDANARVGSIQTPGIGPVEPQRENENGAFLRWFSGDCGLSAVNTFFSAGHTWTDSNGHKLRIDYVKGKTELAMVLRGHRSRREWAEVAREGGSRL